VYDKYGVEIPDEPEVEGVVHKFLTHGGASVVPISELCPEIAGVKYSEVAYDPKKCNVWAHTRRGESLTLWLIPK
jgi:hypothetical protein